MRQPTSTAVAERPHPGHGRGHCCMPQPFDRLSYLYGQVLTPAHLRRAQESVYEKLKLHNRCFEGWGIGCGLWVSPVPMPKDPCAPECPPEGTPPPKTGEQPAATKPPPQFPKDPCNVPKTKIHIDCGFAVDCEGNDLVVRTPIEVDLYSALGPDARNAVGDGQPHTLYVSLCFKTCGFEPIRTVTGGACGISCDGNFAFEREGVCVQVGLDPPKIEEDCEHCCEHCEDCCVPLARVDGYVRGVAVGTVDDSVRRPLARWLPTTITGVSWYHASHYRPADIDEILFKRGVTVKLSRKVQTDTLVQGVCDVFIYELGTGRSGTVRVLEGHIEPPGADTTDTVTYKLPYRERIDPGDRVVFVFRADHVLDRCCQPVDGNHVGGLVPALPNSVQPQTPRGPVHCLQQRHHGAWTSGNHVPGGTFETWIHAEEEGGEIGPGDKRSAP